MPTGVTRGGLTGGTTAGTTAVAKAVKRAAARHAACLFLVVGFSSPLTRADDKPIEDAPPSSGSPGDKTVLAGVRKRTLAELIEVARTRSVGIGIAEAQVKVRESQKDEAIRSWAPTGELTAGITLVPQVECQDPDYPLAVQNPDLLPGGQDNAAARAFRQQHCLRTVGNGGDVVSSAGVFSSLSSLRHGAGQISVSLTQPIYTFGKIEHGYSAAKHGVAAEKARVDIARDEAELLAVRAYWGLKAARVALITLGDARDEIQGFVDKIQEDLESNEPHYGVNDLQRIKIARAVVDLGVADVTRNIATALAGLFAIAGEPTEVDDQELDPQEIVEHSLDWYQTEARRQRPEFHALFEGVAALREIQLLRRSEMLPDIGLNLSFTWRYAPSIDQPENGFLNQANVLGIGGYLGLRQPLDLAQRHARYTHARADADVLAATQRAALTQIDFEIAQAYANVTEARQRVHVADKAQHIAQGWLNAVKQNLDLGIAESRDLVDAARNYFDLRLQYYRAIYDVNLSIAQLRKATGVAISR